MAPAVRTNLGIQTTRSSAPFGSRLQGFRDRDADREALTALLNAPTEARLLIDPRGTILALNLKAHERLEELAGKNLGRKPQRLVGTCVYDLFPADLAVERQARNARVLCSGKIERFEDERDGRWMDNTICPVVNAGGVITGLAILSRDITELKLAHDRVHVHARQLEAINQHLMETLERAANSERQLERALQAEKERARRDTLTGVLNHGAIVEELRALVVSRPDDRCAVAMVDVDGMKATNDVFGHLVGDEALVLVARALSRAGALVGRYGGDEFVAILPQFDRDDAERYCNDVMHAVQTTKLTAPQTGRRVPLVISVGVAVYPDDGDIATELVNLADRAMYLSRRARPIRRRAA